MSTGPQFGIAVLPLQHTDVEPQLSTGNEMTAEPLPPSRPASNCPGSAVILAIADDVTRTWPAFAVRFVAGKPPGIGWMPQPLQPPPPLHENAKTIASTTTTP